MTNSTNTTRKIRQKVEWLKIDTSPNFKVNYFRVINSGFSHSRPGSAESRNSWLNMTRSAKTFKEHSVDKSVKRIDAIIEKDTSFIQSLEQKVIDREIAKKQASELLNKRWNDNIYRKCFQVTA